MINRDKLIPHSDSFEFILQSISHPITSERLSKIKKLCESFPNDNLIWGIASSARVTSLVADALVRLYGPDKIPQRWLLEYDKNRFKIYCYLCELDSLDHTLKDAGFDIVILENGALARAIYQHPEYYSFGDFDLLVKSENTDLLHNILCNNGYSFVLKEAGAGPRSIYSKLLTGGLKLRLNIQSVLVARNWFAGKWDEDIDQFFKKSLVISGGNFRRLCNEHFLFQLCVHNGAHCYVRKPGIRLHLDIDWFLRNANIDWRMFLDSLVKRYSTTTMVYYSLLIPKAIFGTPVPDEVLETLKPPKWKESLISRWIQFVGLFGTNENKITRIGCIILSALLYDDILSLWRGIFPNQNWMRKRYNIHSNFSLLYYHIRRFKDMALRYGGTE